MTQRLANQRIVCALAVMVMGALLLCGCSRAWYRKMADRDAACLIESRQFDSRWEIPDRVVEPDPTSRLADINDPDCGPLPPDDPAANHYMRKKPWNSKRRVKYWDRRGTGAMIDAEQWLEYLPYDEEGEVVLTKELAVDLALLHSREFQGQVEQLYLQALSLSQNRFEFNLQWSGGTGATIDASGAEGIPRDIINPSRLSVSRNFASGGQFVADLINSITYQVGGGRSNFATGNLLFSLTQPLLRNAFRHVRTEGLTQSERSLLYSVRDFTRFRRIFYLNVVQQYLGLLSQSQQIRIEEENIRSLEQNLEFHKIKLAQGTISQIQIDQIFQDKQNGRISLIRGQQGLQGSLDQFKFTLGLPAKINIKLDEAILEPFTLNSKEVEKLQADADELASSLTKYIRVDAPQSYIVESFAKLKKLHETATELQPQIVEEMERWKARVRSKSEETISDTDQQLELEFQASLSERIEQTVVRLEQDLARTAKRIAANEKVALDPASDPEEIKKPVPEFNPSDPEAPPSPDQAETVELLSKLRIDEELSPARIAFNRLEASISSLLADINNLFVSQTQIRLFLIDITPVEIEEDTAIQIALANRLDLMNDRARVVDSYRAVEIAADQLESDLNLSANAILRTDPDRDNGFRFDGESSRYSVGLQFDGPLNRFSERNSYRAAQISYQQQRRSYMASEDSIVNEIRADLRNLVQSRFGFQTSRQSLIAAARQVDQARERVQNTTELGDSSVTQDLLNSLRTLREARNGLISSWLGYEVARISLFVDLELLLLDEQGRWINEDERLQYSEESVESLLPDAEEFETGNDNDAAPDDTTEAELDAVDADRRDLEVDLEPADPQKPEKTTPELPDLSPPDDAVEGNESSQTTWPRATRASRTSSRRFPAGNFLRR